MLNDAFGNTALGQAELLENTEIIEIIKQTSMKHNHGIMQIPGIAFTKSRKSKINRKCYRKCDFQAFDWLKFTLTTDLRFTTFCEIDHCLVRLLCIYCQYLLKAFMFVFIN